MATGLKIPLGPSASGGMAKVNGDENDVKIIKAALADTDNENAWQQDLGLGDDIVFDINDPLTHGRVNRKLKKVFEDFEDEKRFKLFVNTIRWESDSETQELTLSFKYLNMESDEEKEFTSKYSSKSFGG